MAEILRVVTRLLERAEDQRGERLPAAVRPPDVVHDELARLGCDSRGGRGRELVGGRRRRDAQVGKLLLEELDRVRVRALVYAVQRFAAA